ncbi:transposase family protein [Micromonospora fulviviridis]|uniref:Transposase family protein n=1 Tax=Micromonospora fulviviridis TaxID=47860 RepID=A0ABV2VUW1_9ACTN
MCRCRHGKLPRCRIADNRFVEWPPGRGPPATGRVDATHPATGPASANTTRSRVAAPPPPTQIRAAGCPCGVRHRLTVVVTAAVCAVVAGYRSYTAIAEWIADLPAATALALGIAPTRPSSRGSIASRSGARQSWYGARCFLMKVSRSG